MNMQRFWAEATWQDELTQLEKQGKNGIEWLVKTI
jgi:hypothetical protein